MYSLRITKDFDKQIKKLDKSTQVMVACWIRKHLVNCEDPRVFGKALAANLKGYWRYRIGSYRIVAQIKNKELVLLLVAIGHKSEIYSA